MSTHLWIQENLDAYLAGGLTADERDRFDTHTAGCAECARLLSEARQLEQAVGALFPDARPDHTLEERMIKQLSTHQPRRPGWPLWARFAGGVAAVVLFSLVGGGVHIAYAMLTQAQPAEASNNLREIGLELQQTRQEVKELAVLDDSRSVTNEPGIPPPSEANGRLSVNESDLSPGSDVAIKGRKSGDGWSTDTDIIYSIDRLDGVSVPGAANPSDRFNRWGFADVNGSMLGLADEKKPSTPDLRAYARWERLAENPEKATVMSRDAYFILPMKPAPVASPPFPTAQAPVNLTLPPQNVVEEVQKKEEPLQAKQPQEGQPAERKIIRTGDMQFEIDVFDAAIETISKLVAGVKGGFVGTINSEKLANGKVRGSIVVRMPPESLDKFLTDLRRELSKVGDLKSQRIGSQDVTKQYTDIESRLRAARIIEERLLALIKNAKGEVKDLVAAERELGIWRTKIEEMEGEIRYYKNQVSLSTLTIALVEKEIQAPSALVVTEKVGMKLEVEDVEKSHQAALAAIAAVKGRVTRSEVKQYAQGHLKAHVHVEVAPAKAPELAEQLKKLGVLTHHEATRTQEARGGAGKPQELKPTVSDVAFEIELYNAANIRPREAFKLLIATLDVPGSYRKLHDAVAMWKGQVREAKLDEVDKLKISAQFDFDILASDKPAADKLLAAIGPLVSRSTEQAPANELATDRKVGYRLVLRSVAGIQPRERTALTIEVADVDTNASEMKKLILAAQGIVVDSKLRHEANGIVTSALVFDVPLSSNDSLVDQVKKSGTVRTQQAVQNPQVPENALATARIEVTLTNARPIVPNDEGVGSLIRKGLGTSFTIFSYAITFLITGVLVIVPCAIAMIYLTRFLLWIWRRQPAESSSASRPA